MNNTHANSKTHEHIARSSNKTQATNTSKTKQIKAILDENTAKINITPRNRLRAHGSSLGTARSSSFSKLRKNLRLLCLSRLMDSSGWVKRSNTRTIFARRAKQKQRTLENKANQSNVSRSIHFLQNNRSKNNAVTHWYAHICIQCLVTARSSSSPKLWQAPELLKTRIWSCLITNRKLLETQKREHYPRLSHKRKATNIRKTKQIKANFTAIRATTAH